MKILMYSNRDYDKFSFRAKLASYPGIQLDFDEAQLTEHTVKRAIGYDAVCLFVNDKADRHILELLNVAGVKHIFLRCAGTNNVDLEAAKDLNITVDNVPGYSPESVAEHALALLMTVNRRTHKAYTRVRDNNFSLTGLTGYCLYGKTVGIVGMGHIGQCFANICAGLGMKIIYYDPVYSSTITNRGGFFCERVMTIDELYTRADVISLHVPLTPENRHMINKESIAKMKDNVILINVSRGGLIDNEALIEANKQGKFFGIGLDVYEGEDDNAFTNHEDDILMNCITSRLLSFPNIAITSHQAFLTDVALDNIATSVLDTANKYEGGATRGN